MKAILRKTGSNPWATFRSRVVSSSLVKVGAKFSRVRFGRIPVVISVAALLCLMSFNLSAQQTDLAMAGGSDVGRLLTAPAFKMKATDGKSVSLADYSGKYVIMNFWASTSSESRAANVELAKLEKKYGKANVVFVGVSLDESEAAWKEAISKDGLTGLQAKDAAVARQFAVKTLPTVYLISPDGCIFNEFKNADEAAKGLEYLFGTVN